MKTITIHGIEMKSARHECLPFFAQSAADDVQQRFFREQDTMRGKIDADGYREGNVLYWKAVPGRPVPVHCFKDAGLVPTREQTDAYNDSTAKAIASYKANQRPHTGEELAEMRAAFGEGETVVDVFTGRKVTL